ncbi:MAG: DUF115 domain-containing protein [Deltaproteobacteria bacterium]|nr:DUF115 domain-containing protein [Deltaproteobacteria bacterium]
MEDTNRLEQNLHLLARSRPQLAEEILGAPDLPEGMLFWTDSGYPNLRISIPGGKTKTLYLGEVPDFESQLKDTPSQKGEDTATVMLGFGLGFLANMFARRMDPNHPFIILEFDLRILKAAFRHTDLSPLLNHPKIYWIRNNEELEETFDKLQNDVVVRVHAAFRSVYMESQPALYQSLRQKIQNLIYHVTGSAKFVELRGLLTTANSIRNLPHRITNQGAGRLFGQFKGIPAVLIGGGPSLEHNLFHLRGYEDRVLIICSDSALRLTLAMGITPHFVTCIDPLELNLKKFEGVPVPPHVSLVCPPVVNCDILNQFPGPIFFHLRSRQDVLWSSPAIGDEGYLKPVTTVALLSLHLALSMGCDPIVLMGQDLAFSEDKTHAAGQDTWSYKSLPEETIVAVRDVWGREVKTVTQFLGFAQVFELEASTNRRRFINASESGISLKGYQPMRLKDALNSFCIRPEKRIQEPWWLEPARALDRSNALASMIESLERHNRTLKRLMQLCSKIKPSKVGSRFSISPKAVQSLDHICQNLPGWAPSLFLLAGTSATLLRWTIRTPPAEMARLFRRDMDAAFTFSEVARNKGPELLRALDEALQRLRLLAAAETGWEGESREHLHKLAHMMWKQKLPAVAQSLFQQVTTSEAHEDTISSRLEILLQMNQQVLVLREDWLEKNRSTSRKAAQILERAHLQQEAWNRYVRIVREKYVPREADPRQILSQGALFYFRAGNVKHADALLSAYVSRYGETGAALCLKGEFLLGSAKWDQALPTLRRAAELEPNNPKALKLLGRACLETGSMDKAESCLLKAIEADPDDVQTHETLAELYFRSQRVKDALATLERALERFPSSFFLREKLDMVRGVRSPDLEPTSS